MVGFICYGLLGVALFDRSQAALGFASLVGAALWLWLREFGGTLTDPTDEANRAAHGRRKAAGEKLGEYRADVDYTRPVEGKGKRQAKPKVEKPAKAPKQPKAPKPAKPKASKAVRLTKAQAAAKLAAGIEAALPVAEEIDEAD